MMRYFQWKNCVIAVIQFDGKKCCIFFVEVVHRKSNWTLAVGKIYRQSLQIQRVINSSVDENILFFSDKSSDLSCEYA